MDKIFYNGKIYSIDADNRQYSAIGVRDGKIAFLGNDAEAASLPAKERVDLSGKTMLPGFIDSHLHMLYYAFVAGSYNMSGADSIESIIAEGRRRVQDMESRDAAEWFYGTGWNQQNFAGEKRMLTRRDLDAISTARPILFIRVCGHAAAVNGKGLEILLQSAKTKEYIDQIDTENGILKEGAVTLCCDLLNSPSADDIKKMILHTQRELNRRGITSVETDNFLSLPGKDRRHIVRAYKELDGEGRLTVRVREQASFAAFSDMKEFIDEGNRTGQGSDYYKTGCVKIFQDGSLGAKTALLNEPYSNAPDNSGIMMHDEEDLQRCVDYAYKNDMQILVHAIGDKASDMVCSSFEKTIAKYGRKERRLAINHVQIVSGSLFDRMSENGVSAYIQPAFVASDKAIVRDFVGAERSKTAYGWKTMINKGILCCGGSDAPVESFDVLASIQIAVTRDRLDEATAGWHPQEKLSVLEAVRLFTINNARAALEDDKKGSLEPGKFADMAVLDGDPFLTDPHKIADIPVLRTVVGGVDVFVG